MKWTNIKKIIRLRWPCRLSYIYLTLFIAFLGVHSSYAQVTKIDSLYAELSDANLDSERLPLMDELVNELINIDLKKALALATKALDLSKKTNNKLDKAKALNNMGLVLYETKERPASLKYYEQSEQIAEELGLLELQSLNLMSIAKYHRYVSHDSTKTVNTFLKSAEVSKATDFHWGTGRSYAKLASFYTGYNQIDLCEKYLKLAAKYYTKNPDGVKTVAHYYNEVGDKLWHLNPKKSMDFYFKGREYSNTPTLMVSLAKAYNYIGDNVIAIRYLKEAIPLLRLKEKRRGMLGVALAQLAEAYIQLGDYEAADKTSEKGIKLLTGLGRSDQKGIPALYRVKGIIMEQKGNEELALEYFTKSFSEAKRIKFTFERIKSILTLGVFHSIKTPEKGKKLCKKALKDAKKRKYTNLEIEACDCLYKIYKEEASHIDALNYHEQKTILSDSLSTIKVSHALDINNTIAKKNELIAEQSYQKEIKEKELKNQYLLNTTLAASTLLGLFFIGFLIRSHKQISHQNKEINKKTEELVNANQRLEHSNNELERFAHIASHDLKTPLRNMLNFTGLLRQKFGQAADNSANEYLAFIENSGKRMNQLIEDLLEYSQLSNQVTRAKEIIDLNRLVGEITQFAKNTPNAKPVIFDVSELPNLKWYHSKIFLLFKNIIENGIKYNKSKNPIIKVYATNTAGVHSIYIEDNGIGIKQEYFDKIFVMFNRLHTKQEFEGTGLGLATCKKIVTEFDGKISISSEINKGTIFKIELPNDLIHHPVDRDKTIHKKILIES